MSNDPTSPSQSSGPAQTGTTNPDPKRLATHALSPDYVNGMHLAVSQTDVQIIFTLFNIPKRMMVLPYGLAKSLGSELTNLMQRFEADMGFSTPSPKEVSKKMREVTEKAKGDEEKKAKP